MSRQEVAVMRDALDAGQIRALQMEANRRALAKKNLRKGILIGLNTIVAFVILLPLLYAFSVAFMPSSELFTTEMNLIPKQPTLENFRQALVKVPLVRFVKNQVI